jgi:hypothetical protein
VRHFCLVVAMFSQMLSAALGWQDAGKKPQIPADLKQFVIGNPPQASARVTLPSNSKLLRKDSLGSVGQMLSTVLSSRGYADQKWFVVSQNGTSFDGIAAMSRLERIDDSGKPVLSDRFSQEPFNPDIISLSDYFKRLVANGSKGRYRSFFFYLTFAASPRQTAPPQIGELNKAFFSGASGGPAFENIKISWPLTCTAYIYGFERQTADGQIGFISNDAMSGQAHLAAADLWTQLGPD